MIDVQVIINDKRINTRLAKLEYMLTGPAITSLLHVGVVPMLRADAQERFATEGASDGRKWRPLKDSTIRIRDELGFPAGPINVRTGTLKSYVTTALGNTVTAGDYSQVTWPGTLPMDRSKLKYALATAQNGASSPSTPARPVINLSPKVIAGIYAAIAAHVKVGLK